MNMQIAQERVDLNGLASSVKHLPMFRADVKSGIFAEQLVRATLNELFRFEYFENKWISGELINISSNVSDGAKEYSFVEIGHTGRAKIVADNATDLPAAEVEGRNNIRPVKTVATYVTYSTQDVRTSRLQGLFDIATEKAQAAREAMDTTLNDLIRSGDAATGLLGVTNHPGITIANAVTGNWQTASAPQIVNDFTIAAKSIIDSTDGVEVPDTAVFDVASFTRISTLPFDPAGGTTTVLEYLQKAFPMINRWTWDAGMKDQSAAGGPAVLIYRKDQRRLRCVIPMMMRALPPEQRGLNFSLAFETRFGGVMSPRPKSILRLDGVGTP